MKHFLAHFFRANEDTYTFEVFGRAHFFLIGIMLLVSYMIIKNREIIRDNEQLKTNIKNTIYYSLLVEQVIFYSWYMFSGVFSWAEALPLYMCRVSMISILVAFTNNSTKAKTISILFGLIGGPLAIGFPVLDHYSFPHITNITFFLGHFLMFWAVIYMLSVEEFSISKEDFKFARIFLNIFIAVSYIVNLAFKANYNFLIEAPLFNDIFSQLSSIVYVLIYTLLLNIIFSLLYKYLGTLKEKTKASFDFTNPRK